MNNIDTYFPLEKSNKITIMHVISGLTVGGAELMLFRVATCCGTNLIRHVVVSMSNLGPVGQLLEQAGIKVFTLKIPNGSLNFNGIRYFVYLLKKIRPDVVQTWMFHADFFGGLLAFLFSKTPIVWNIRQSDTTDDKFIKRMLSKAINPFLSYFVPKQIVCCGDAIKTVYADKGYSSRRLISIPNGCDTMKFKINVQLRQTSRKDFNLDSKDLAIGVVGRFHSMKDHQNFVRALGLLRFEWPQVIAIFCGEGLTSDNLQLVGWLVSVGFPLERCRFLGRQADMLRVYSMLDVLVSSSRSGEGFPNVLIEAMSCGVPCVATDVGCSREIVGASSQIVPPDNSDELAVAISGVLKIVVREPSCISSRVRQHVLENFSFEETMQSYERLYLSVAAHPKLK